MRTRRIKVAAETGAAVYHCMSRVVNGERVLDQAAREVLRKQLWQVADFAGIEVLTYAILSNHFHVLVRVPQKAPVSDTELLRRYGVLYPRPTKYQTARLETIKAYLAIDGPEAQAWRRRQLALMGDVSAFMKLLNQRFAIWFNQHHQRFGPLWCGRFKSVLVEPQDRVIQAMAAYIDLNCVRAGLAGDPKDYRFCGYAEAVAGHTTAQRGIRAVASAGSWRRAHAEYRKVLFATGAGSHRHGASVPLEELRRVIKVGGQLPLATVLRCRLRYFSDGLVLGGRAFVESHVAEYQRRNQLHRHSAPRLLPAVTSWGELATLHPLRGEAVG